MNEYYLCDYCKKMLGAWDMAARLSRLCICDAYPKLHPKKVMQESKTPGQVCKHYE